MACVRRMCIRKCISPAYLPSNGIRNGKWQKLFFSPSTPTSPGLSSLYVCFSSLVPLYAGTAYGLGAGIVDEKKSFSFTGCSTALISYHQTISTLAFIIPNFAFRRVPRLRFHAIIKRKRNREGLYVR